MWDVYSLWYYDWSNLNISDVQDQLKYSEHKSYCYFGSGDKSAVSMIIWVFKEQIIIQCHEGWMNMEMKMLSVSIVNWFD